MKKYYILIILMMTIAANSQNNLNIPGVYKLSNDSPEGGSSLFVLENGDYAIIFFGGMQYGTWKKLTDNSFEFKPNKKEYRFELYGRVNTALKQKTKMLFRGFENDDAFIQLRENEDQDFIMQRVFNEDANCFSPKYIHTFNTIPKSIAFLSFFNDGYGRTPQLISLDNPKGYNDFVVYSLPIHALDNQSFTATFKRNSLYLDEEKVSSTKRSLSDVQEDVIYIKQSIEKLSKTDFLYLNPSYNEFGNAEFDEEKAMDINDYHVFDIDKNAYIDTEYYDNDVDYTDSDLYFDDMSIVYIYNALKTYRKNENDFTIIEKPLFLARCD